ncbi:DivIVA domain-containing protein [Actinoplanes flavus]|uniref:Cell wall synthesis protein Wag31 n=1 Tax=Actinoplanes flavus TaxID=2820290 RepID=A0ABS3UZN7_9ACTN|nr:DivIVA domain-containing protein [Actinoplanes flavus]MBO3744045.1 DivIVA domain-containing protein [Actinoplanes flavus]
MSLTPADVGKIEFREPPAGGRGYHEGEVNRFLDDVAGEMQRLAAENRALAERLEYDDLAGHLRKLERKCARAQARAAALRAELEQARAAAAPVPATPVSPHLLRLAQRTADDYVAEARREASELLKKASVEASLVVSDAELRASTIVADARHAHAERVNSLDGKRARALARIEELGEEARRRREALAGDVAYRLRRMDGTH